MDFDPSLLRAFVAVKETGGFTRAAERLHLTQSAVSHQIRKLEEQVGRQLLRRTTRSLTVTEDGEDFLRYAQQILDTLDAMTQRFQPSPISGVVRFGLPDNFMGDRLAPLLAQFARAFPSVRMEVSVDMHLDLRSMIRAGELDLAVVMSPVGCSEGTRLRRTQLVWAAAESFEAPKGASLPMAFFPKPCVNRHVSVDALQGTAVDWHVVFTSASPQGIRAAVLAGLAVTVLTREDVEPGMKIVDGRYGLPPLPSADFALIWSEGSNTACVCRFGQMILEMPGLQVPAVSAEARASAAVAD
jgi:DNA-binding transcriptional LysR family regulator